MALIRCKECGKDISSAAAACPSCGKPLVRTSATAKGCLTIIILGVVLVWVGQCSEKNDDLPLSSKPAPAAEPATVAPEPASAAVAAPTTAPASTIPETDAKAAVTNDKPNLNDASALDDKYGSDAFIECGIEADDYLRAASKYAFKWDDLGFLEQKFGKYRNHVASPGVLTMVSNRVSIQNGYGAYERIELLCDYDTQAKKVLGYKIDSL